ncbi:MAG: peptidase M48 Ste24p [Gemmatimonadetes bacterium]|nr:peptidase M48 Ste24p [Gemmatimonadota bacterium]
MLDSVQMFRISAMTRRLPRSFRAAALVAIATAVATSGCAINQQREVEIGTDYAKQVEQQLPIIRDAEIVRYINLLGDSLARVTDTRGLDWSFAVVDDMTLNAFAIPGGFIFINRGLVAKATSLAQVAGVLGHEIGHVTKRHSVKQMQQRQGTAFGVAAVCVLTDACNSGAAQSAIDLAAGGVFSKFSRDDEAEADREGIETAIRAGIDPNGVPELFQLLLDERKSRPTGVETFFISHPLEESRISATRQLIATVPPERLRGLVRDNPAFQAFKRRLAALPPSPEKKPAAPAKPPGAR